VQVQLGHVGKRPAPPGLLRHPGRMLEHVAEQRSEGVERPPAHIGESPHFNDLGHATLLSCRPPV
jgi:hypothetical protein